MTLSSPGDSSRQGLLEEVLGEYMQRLDRGRDRERTSTMARPSLGLSGNFRRPRGSSTGGSLDQTPPGSAMGPSGELSPARGRAENGEGGLSPSRA
jgi:hypothetical protein